MQPFADTAAVQETDRAAREGSALAATALAKSRASADRAASMQGMWHGQSQTSAPGMGTTVSSAQASQRGIRKATPAELWPGLIPRSTQQINRVDEIEPSQTMVEPVLVTEPAEPDRTEEEREQVAAQPMAPEPIPVTASEVVQESAPEVVDRVVDSEGAAFEAEVAGLPVPPQAVVSSADEGESEPYSESDTEAFLQETATLPDGSVTGIEWVGMDSDLEVSVELSAEAEAPEETEAPLSGAEPLRDGDQTLRDARWTALLEQHSLSESYAQAYFDTIEAVQTEEPNTMVEEEEEFDPDDHPEFANVLDRVDGTRAAPVVSRQMEAAASRASVEDSKPGKELSQIPVESLFSGVAGTIGSGLGSVAQAGKYAVMGVKYCAEDGNVLLHKAASLFKRKKKEEDEQRDA